MNGPPGPEQPPEIDPDVALMQRAAAGDREAYEALYRRWAGPVMSFLYHLCWDGQTAEDWTQEVFLKAWRAAPGYRPMGRFSTWLFQIAKHHAWNERARWRRLRPAADPEAGADRPAPDEAPDRAVRRRELAAAIRAAIEGLTPRLRMAFVLVRLEGRSYAETAEILEVPEGTVKSRMAAAEAALRGRLGSWL